MLFGSLWDALLRWETWVAIAVGAVVSLLGIVATIIWMLLEDQPEEGERRPLRARMQGLLLRRFQERREPEPAADGDLSLKDLAVLIDGLSRTSEPQETRRTKRRWGNPIKVRIKTPDRDDPVRGWVLNRSECGVAVLADEAFAPDAVVTVRPARAPEEVPWVDMRVRHCRSVELRSFLTCEYVDPPAWNVQVWFG